MTEQPDEQGGAAGASGFCPRCGRIVPTWHPRPRCDAYYAQTYAAAARTEPDEGAVEAVLTEHAVTSPFSSGADCECGWFQLWPRERHDSGIFRKQHAAHVAAALRAAGVLR